MGCICSKGTEDPDCTDIQKDASKASCQLFASSEKENQQYANKGSIENRKRISGKENAAAVMPAPPSPNKMESIASFTRTVSGHQRRATVDVGAKQVEKNERPELEDEPSLGIVHVPNGLSGEHVATGWPKWLLSVAAEAVKGWQPRRADSFEKLDKIGQGTYSSVYKARDLETGKVVALKKVRFVNMDPESVRFMAREIQILRKLDHPNVLKLEGIVTSRMSCSLYLVFEYMEHDLAGLAARPGIKFTEPQVKCYMQQLLQGLEHCHSRGVLHRDIKGSNLLVDDNGILRIGDFGLATFFSPHQKQQLTSRVVTLWYRPPELLLGATEYGVAVDLWSAGCILAELLAGKPIMPGRTEVEQLHKIFKLCGSPAEDYWKKNKLPHATIFKPQHPYRRCFRETFKDLPPSALSLLDSLLAIEPEVRGTAASALKSEFFTMMPLACDPSSLPKYPPSKEYDAKLRDQEARRQKAAAVKENGHESVRTRETRAQQRNVHNDQQKSHHAQAAPKSTSEKFSEEDGASGFPIDPPRCGTENAYAFGQATNRKTREGQRTIPSRSTTSLTRSNGPEFRTQRSYMSDSGAVLASYASVRESNRPDNCKDRTESTQWTDRQPSVRYNQLDVADTSHHVLDRPASTHKKDAGKEVTHGYGTKKNRIHYSGPLMPPGGNIEDMLREHERQIQQAVRKARLDKNKTNINMD